MEYFFWGILSALGALFLEVLTSIFTEKITSPWLILFIPALIEELAKGLFVFQGWQRWDKLNQKLKGLLGISLGFAVTEIFFLFYQKGGSFLLANWEVLLLIAVFHLASVFLIGSLLSRLGRSLSALILVIGLAGMIHALFNSYLTTENSLFPLTLTVGGIIAISLLLFRKK